ncbi:MAG TPA: penicillin-binding transpeptidase domain-containing protein, partial [Thermodesulfobacteriota bacterium]|nr:penicillin-binding transpeptidase domain-containing protein [Thermodesulfobacteriota bacterium]
NVPIYQELARRVGLERMRESVTRLDYGNKDIGNSVDTFWLTGPLKISAVEQTRFLARLAQGKLPFPKDAQNAVREITLVEKGGSWELHGKTGWENAPGRGAGWWIGWVTRDDRVHAFALNIDIQKESDASKRVELGKAGLKALGVI